MEPMNRALKYCTPHPNGTYDLVPMVDGDFIRFKWGNSLMLITDERVKEAETLIGRVWKVHPRDKLEFLKLPQVEITERK